MKRRYKYFFNCYRMTNVNKNVNSLIISLGLSIHLDVSTSKYTYESIFLYYIPWFAFAGTFKLMLEIIKVK